ncbi:MAG: hypothetical protein ACT4PL_09860 [Phycisphaerales bacterium]
MSRFAMDNPVRRAALALLGAVCAVAGGCAGSRPEVARVAATSGGLTAGLPALFAPRWLDVQGEVARRDGALALTQAEPLLATEEWPEPRRPTLAERRVINLRASSFGESILYFSEERRR